MDVDALRAQTPGCAHRVHLNNAGAALLAQPTLDAMLAHLRLEAEIGGYEAARAAQPQIAGAYEGVAELLGGRSDEIAFFDNANHDLGVHRCAIVTAQVNGRTAADVAAALCRARINVTTTVPEHTRFDTEERGVHPLVRLSPHYYNTEAEVDRATERVAALGH